MVKARKAAETTKGATQLPTVDVLPDTSKKVCKSKSSTKATKVTKPVERLLLQ